MATTFLEPGGDADFAVATTNGFWVSLPGSPTVATDFVHGTHVKSIKYPSGGSGFAITPNSLADSGSRISSYIYLNALPSITNVIAATVITSAANGTVQIQVTSGGVLQLADFVSSVQIGTNGATLTTGKWYRICLAYTVTSTTINRFELFLDGVSTISVTNATVSSVGSNRFLIGNASGNTAIDMRSSDHYVDDSSSLTDTGNIWVTAKRPNANGTTNGFNTQIGSGGSGYGSGHSPQVNERPLSVTNGWSKIGAGAAVTEEYNIENKATGDIDISTATIIDYLGWISTKALAGETVNIIVNGVNFAQAITSTNTVYKKVAGSSTYPAGTGTDIGEQTDTSLTTVSLFECGIIVAYIPAVASTAHNLPLLGVGV